MLFFHYKVFPAAKRAHCTGNTERNLITVSQLLFMYMRSIIESLLRLLFPSFSPQVTFSRLLMLSIALPSTSTDSATLFLKHSQNFALQLKPYKCQFFSRVVFQRPHWCLLCFCIKNTACVCLFCRSRISLICPAFDLLESKMTVLHITYTVMMHLHFPR